MRGEEVARALALQRCIALAADVPGDFVECGVGRGASFVALVLIAQAEGRQRHVWGFDSFQGFPDPSAEDDSPRRPRRGELHFGTADEIGARILRSDVDAAYYRSHCHLVPGFFDDTLATFTGRIAFLHLDVDLYRSYRSCLEVLYPKISPGGIVLFDEYTEANFPGARRAIDEYFGDRVRELQHDPYLDARFFMKPREASR
jgi:Macrocin-O-methyltransferase (TylF)